MKNRSASYVVLIFTALISFVGVVSHAIIASGFMDEKLTEVGQWAGVDPAHGPALAAPVSLPNNAFVDVAGNGVYNFKMTLEGGGRWSWLIENPVVPAVFIALSPSVEIWGVFMPFPFLLPFVIHITLVWFAPVIVGLVSGRSIAYKVQGYDIRVLTSAVYAYFIVVFFQSTRMFWGSQMWEPGSYLNSHRFGWTILYILLGLCIAIYIYCVIGTAGLQVRWKPTAKKQNCIKCGYGLEGTQGKCPECDLEIGAFVDSKWRINHWYLAAMFMATFFSPVLVASVYSVLG